MIPAARIGTPQGARDLGSARLSAGRAEGSRDTEPRTLANTAPQHREAVTVRLSTVETAAEVDSITSPTPQCFSKEATPRPLVLVDQGRPTSAARVPANIDQVRAMVTQSRAKQGLPPTIEDTDVLERVAAIFKLAAEPAAAPAAYVRPAHRAA